MATIKIKRVRSPDFSEEEIAVIRDSFVKHNKILSAKYTNKATQRAKNAIYLGIVDEVNALGVAERSLQSIKDKWQTMKKNVKEKITRCMRDKRRKRTKTSGGENPILDDPAVIICLDDDDRDVLQVMKTEHITGVSGGFATDEVAVEGPEEDVTSRSGTLSTSYTTTRKRSTMCVPSSSKSKKARLPVMSSSEYYKEMIHIETQKLALMREELELKRWYMEQKIAYIQKKHTPSTP